jgi:hypothetical protein
MATYVFIVNSGSREGVMIIANSMGRCNKSKNPDQNLPRAPTMAASRPFGLLAQSLFLVSAAPTLRR